MPTAPIVDAPPASPYEPPRVEQVLAPEEIAREVHYAGVVSQR